MMWLVNVCVHLYDQFKGSIFTSKSSVVTVLKYFEETIVFNAATMNMFVKDDKGRLVSPRFKSTVSRQ